jgi:hypothetical protein
MMPITFTKARDEYVIDCIRNGKPIEPEGKEWTIFDMVATAGAMHFAASSHGPLMHKGVSWEHLSRERQEAIEVQFFNDLPAAIEYCSKLTMMVADRIFDAQYEATVKATIEADVSTITNKPSMKLVPIEGFKNVTRGKT